VTVYIAGTYEQHEPPHVVGIFSTLDSARTAAEVCLSQEGFADGAYVRAWVLNGRMVGQHYMARGGAWESPAVLP
jgi:hypothetical protein